MERRKPWIGVTDKGILLKQEYIVFHLRYVFRIWLESSFTFTVECWTKDNVIHAMSIGQGDDAIRDHWRQHNLQQNHPNQSRPFLWLVETEVIRR